MTGNPAGLQSLAKYSKLPIEWIDYRPEADASIISSIDRGVLFLMAFWSGPLADGCEKKFNWASELSTQLDFRPFVA